MVHASRVFVAGGSGVVGRQLVPLLVQRGHRVTATSRTVEGTAGIEASGAVPVVLDVFDARATADAMAASRPDVVIHQLTDLATGDLASNARLREVGTRNLVDAARAAGVIRLIAASIAWVYAPAGTPALEGSPFDLSATGARRLTIDGVRAMEETASQLPETVVLRYGTLYGPGTWYSRDGRYGRSARAGELAATDRIVPFVHVVDAAAAAAAALGWPAGTVNVVDDRPATGHEWVPVFASAVGGPPPEHVGGGDPGRAVANHRLHELGLRLSYPDWRDGFATL